MQEFLGGEQRPHAFERGSHLANLADIGQELLLLLLHGRSGGFVGVEFEAELFRVVFELDGRDPFEPALQAAPVAGPQRSAQLANQHSAPFVVGAAPLSGLFDHAFQIDLQNAQPLAAVGNRKVALERALPIAHGAGHDLAHPGIALHPLRFGGVLCGGSGTTVDGVHGEQLDAALTEGRQHLLDVAQERAVGPHDEHAGVFEPLAVAVDQIGRPMQCHRGLAGTRTSLDDQDAREGGPDDVVLFGLDRGDDVGHPPRS